MDTQTLRQTVRDAVNSKLQNNEAFTTVDISHPIIANDGTVRHRHVRSIIDEMWSNGDMSAFDYQTSPITVYPEPTKSVSARLFHPDGFDPLNYQSTNQVLNRSYAGRNLLVADPDGDNGTQGSDSVQKVQTSPSGNNVVAQCNIQSKHDCINVPSVLIKRAGWSTGQTVQTTVTADKILISAVPTGTQMVDKEGRVRIYKGVNGFDRSRTYTALLTSSANGNMIEIDTK